MCMQVFMAPSSSMKDIEWIESWIEDCGPFSRDDSHHFYILTFSPGADGASFPPHPRILALVASASASGT